MRRGRNRIASRILSALIILVVIGMFGYFKFWEKTHLTAETTGVLVGYHEEWEQDDSDDTMEEVLMYYAEVRFNHEGKEYTSTAVNGYNWKHWAQGEKVKIKYNPDDPSEMETTK